MPTLRAPAPYLPVGQMGHRQETNSQTESCKIWDTIDKEYVNNKCDTLV